MKKTVAKIVLLVVITALVLSLVACGSDYKGTYYKYTDGVKDDSDWIKLDKKTWSDNDGESGRLEENNGVIYCYYEMFGEEEVLFWGTVSDGVFKFTFGEKFPTGDYIYYNYYTDKSKADNKNSSAYLDDGNGAGDNSGDNSGGGTQEPPVQKTTYTVSFDSCGGTDVASKSVGEGEKMTAPTQPTKTMFVFSGWYKDSKYKDVWDFDTDRVNEDITLYARWTAEEVRITSVNGAEISGTDIFMVVPDGTDEVDLTNKVVLNSDTATWKLYYDKLGQMEIPTKLATTQSGLRPGSNLFYIVVTSADSTQSKTYTLDVYKKYEVLVRVIGVSSALPEYNFTLLTLATLTAPNGVRIEGYTVTGWESSTVSVGSKLPKDCPTEITLTARTTANKYKATLNANGGTLAQTEKTVTFAKREELGVPTRTGYSFLGWFLGERAVTDESGVCIGWNIADDTTLKAEWRANRYAVSVKASDDEAGTVSVVGNADTVNLYFDNNGVEAANFPVTQEITKENGMRVPSTPTADTYVFKGWYKDSACRESFDFSQDIASDVTAYAGWYRYTYTENSTVSGVITGFGSDNAQSIYTSNSDQFRYFAATTDGTYNLYYRNGSSGSSYATYLSIYDVTASSTVKSNGTISNTSYNAYSFTAQKGHVYYIKVYKYSYSNTFYCYLTRENAPQGGGKIGEGTTAVGEYQSTVKLSATTNDGYTFVGWYNGATQISTDKNYTATVPASDVTYTAKFTYYTVTTNTNLDGAGTYTELNTEKVTAGNTVWLSASTHNGYTWLGWYVGDEKVSESTSLSYNFTMPRSNKTLTAKWIVCPVTLEKNIDEAGTVSGVEGATAVGGEVTITATTNDGYTWLGWYDEDDNKVSEDDSLSYNFTMRAESKIYTAKWTYYTITTTTNLYGAGSYTIFNENKVTVGKEVVLTASTNNGYTWLGWYDGDTKVSKGTSTSHSFTMTTENKTYRAKWIICPVTLEKNIDEAGTVSGVEGATAVGGEVTITATTNDGYTWLGWYDGDRKVSESESASYSFIITAENMQYTARWAYYTVTTNTNLSNGGSYTKFNEQKVAGGNEVTLTAITNNGYTWLGWYDGDTKVSEGTSLSYKFTMDAENKVYTAKWIICPVTLEKNIEEAGTVSGVEGKTAMDGEITIIANTNVGYVWLGWYESDTIKTKNLSYTFLISCDNVNYMAKWELCEEHNLVACVCTKCGISDHTVVMREKGYCRHNNQVYLGYYPQKQVKDTTLIETLSSLSGALPTSSNKRDWTSYSYYTNGEVSDYMWYIDKEYNGERYRGVFFKAYRPVDCSLNADVYDNSYSNQAKAGYYINQIYWFKYEPIKWRILSTKDNTFSLFSDVVIDCQQFYHTEESRTIGGVARNSNVYAWSDIRTWLNNTFYNIAFGDLQKGLISSIFLLPVVDIKNSEYGFSNDYRQNDTMRQKEFSDYAKSQGGWASETSASYWLQSPYENCSAYNVKSNTGVANYVSSVKRILGVAPSINVRLS